MARTIPQSILDRISGGEELPEGDIAYLADYRAYAESWALPLPALVGLTVLLVAAIAFMAISM